MNNESKCLKVMDKIMKGTWHLANLGITTEKLEFTHQQRLFLQTYSARHQCDETMRTLELHAACQREQIIDGQRYWCFRKEGEITGLTGIHYRMWDHPSVVWSTSFMASPDLSQAMLQGMLSSNIYYCLTRTNFREMYIEIPDIQNATCGKIIISEIAPEPVAVFPGFTARGHDLHIMKVNLDELREAGRNIYHLDITH